CGFRVRASAAPDPASASMPSASAVRSTGPGRSGRGRDRTSKEVPWSDESAQCAHERCRAAVSRYLTNRLAVWLIAETGLPLTLCTRELPKVKTVSVALGPRRRSNRVRNRGTESSRERELTTADGAVRTGRTALSAANPT